MKILHVLTSPRAEGTPRLVLDWLTVREYEQEILFLSGHGELISDFEKTGVWQQVNTSFILRFSSAYKIMKLVKNVCEERKPDIVISWPMGFSQWIHIGARWAGVSKLLVHAGNPPGNSFFSRYVFTYLSFWTGYLLGSKVIACSNYIKREFNKIPFLSATPFHFVHNCIRVSKFTEVREVTRLKNQAIMVATLEKHKDHETLLKAWKLLEQKALPYHLLIVGSGSQHSALKCLADSLGLRSIQFMGSRSDIPQLLHQSSVFVLSTTRQEGFGTVLLEALASGCQVIASDVEACREVLQGGRYGKLVPTADAQALANAIEDVFLTSADDGKYELNITYARGFTPGQMMKDYIRIAHLDS